MSNNGIAGRRVLVVEDDYLLAMDMADMLGRAGADVIGPVANVADALRALDEEPEAAVLDVRLGDETSLPVADELARRGVPYLFATGSEGNLPEAHRAHAVCSKPVSDFEVLRALSDALRSRRAVPVWRGPLGKADAAVPP